MFRSSWFGLGLIGLLTGVACAAPAEDVGTSEGAQTAAVPARPGDGRSETRRAQSHEYRITHARNVGPGDRRTLSLQYEYAGTKALKAAGMGAWATPNESWTSRAEGLAHLSGLYLKPATSIGEAAVGTTIALELGHTPGGIHSFDFEQTQLLMYGGVNDKKACVTLVEVGADYVPKLLVIGSTPTTELLMRCDGFTFAQPPFAEPAKMPMGVVGTPCALNPENPQGTCGVSMECRESGMGPHPLPACTQVTGRGQRCSVYAMSQVRLPPCAAGLVCRTNRDLDKFGDVCLP